MIDYFNRRVRHVLEPKVVFKFRFYVEKHNEVGGICPFSHRFPSESGKPGVLLK